MNREEAREGVGLAYLIGIVGSLLIVGLLSWAIYRYTQPPPLGEERAAARSVIESMTMEQRLTESLAPRRFQMLLFGTFAALALVFGSSSKTSREDASKARWYATGNG